MLKEVTMKEAIKILEECEHLKDPIIAKSEDGKKLVFIDINEYNELCQNKNTDTITIEIDSELKIKVEEILDELGLSLEEAVNIFLHQVVLHGGIPFEIKIPNYREIVIE